MFLVCVYTRRSTGFIVLTTAGATCAAGPSVSDCSAAIAAANTAIGKPGFGKSTPGGARIFLTLSSSSSSPKWCYSSCDWDYEGYFNAHATGDVTGTDASNEMYLHCHLRLRRRRRRRPRRRRPRLY
eukprot:scaffold44657_cov71-Phaeocystis_antarctica.AAC.4